MVCQWKLNSRRGHGRCCNTNILWRLATAADVGSIRDTLEQLDSIVARAQVPPRSRKHKRCDRAPLSRRVISDNHSCEINSQGLSAPSSQSGCGACPAASSSTSRPVAALRSITAGSQRGATYATRRATTPGLGRQPPDQVLRTFCWANGVKKNCRNRWTFEIRPSFFAGSPGALSAHK